MSTPPSAPLPSGFTAAWSKTDEPVPTRRRNAATQEAYDFFHALPLNTVVLIPAGQENVARSAGRQYSLERPEFKVSFQPTGNGLKAWKSEKPVTPPAAS